MFEFRHLPIAGGIFDQDPMLMEAFRTIFIEKAKVEEEKERREKANKGGRQPNVKNA